MTSKICARCKVDKPLTEYHKDPKGRQGLRRVCKPCAVAITDEWRRANLEKVAIRASRYYHANKTLKTKVCLNCKVEYPANGTARKYCTDECKAGAQCSVDGCIEPVSIKEQCRHHYTKQWEASNRERLQNRNLDN